MASKREIKDQIYENIAVFGKAIASAKRLEILALLTQGEKSVEAIAEHLEMNFKVISARTKPSRYCGKRAIRHGKLLMVCPSGALQACQLNGGS